MDADEIYFLRRSLLEAVKCYRNPVSLDDVLCYPPLRSVESTLALDEWRNLVSRGFLEPVPGSDGRYCRLSAKGSRQFERDAERSAYIWGRFAL